MRGADLKHIFSFFLNTEKSNVEIPDHLDTAFYEVVYIKGNKAFNKKEKLLDLLRLYNLQYTVTAIKDEGIELFIQDEEKLKNYSSSSSTVPSVSLENNRYILSNVNLRILTKNLKEVYSKEFSTSNINRDGWKFNVTYELSNDLPEVLDLLEKKYGISYTKKETTVDKYKFFSL